MISPMLAGLGPTELVLIIAVIVLLFGASKLPELARGSGRALRIFKAETKGLMDDDESKTDEQREIEARAKAQADAERIAREQGDTNA
jgi:sec-independent protein translocase protein TatA